MGRFYIDNTGQQHRFINVIYVAALYSLLPGLPLFYSTEGFTLL